MDQQAERLRILFGRRLQALREERQLSQRELGERIGVEQAHISKLERGDGLPSLPVMLRLAAFFSVSVDDFFRPEREAA